MEVVHMTHAAGHDVADLALQRSSQDNDLTSSSDTKSIPASQASSFGESASSQLASQHEFKSVPQASANHDHNAQGSHQTSAPAIDVTDLQYLPVEGTNPATAPTVPRINTTFKDATASQPRPNGVQYELKQGQKRTANGHVKTPSSSTITSPESATIRGHARQTSQVGELSAQLRARLSYAMVKIQHGWQSRTIDEVETLASQQPSPMSAIASPHRSLDSPRSTLSTPVGENSNFPHSSVRTNVPLAASMMATPQLNAPIHHDHAYPPNTQPSYAHAPTAPFAPSLAPPVDFSHSNTHRISKKLSPHSLLNGSRHPSNLSASSTSSGNPHTPPQLAQIQSNSAVSQTPSQSATAMEQDAIETLLFMSSPGNSQAVNHYGHQARNTTAPPGTSLRNGFGVNIADNKIERIEPRKKEVWERANLKDEESIDRVLDQMGDGDDSSDDDDVATTHAPSKVNGIGRGLVYA